MSKYLYWQDGHCKGISPKRRTDDYLSSWMIKFKEMLYIAKKNKVDMIIDGGDSLDSPIIANSIIDDILDLIEANGIPMNVAYGSHCMIGHHRDTSKTSSLYHMLRRSKLLTDNLELQDDLATIKIIEHEHGVEQKIKDSGIIIDGSDGKWKVAITHCMITPKPFRPDVLHVVAKDIKTDANLIITAHYHQPWEQKIGNTEFLNPGCFGRTEISEANIEPSVVILNTFKRSYEIIKLKKAKLGSECFDLTKKENEDTIDNDLESFTNNLKDFKSSTLDLRSTVEIMGKEQKIDRDVIDCILNKLIEVEKA